MAEGGFDFLDHFEGAVGVAEECAAAVALGDFVDGATHVDVDDVRAAILGPAGGFAQAIGAGAIQLHRQRAVFRAGDGQIHRVLIFAENAFGAEQIGAGQADIAARSGDESEGDIAVTGDGREQEIVREADVADLQGLYDHASDCIKNRVEFIFLRRGTKTNAKECGEKFDL